MILYNFLTWRNRFYSLTAKTAREALAFKNIATNHELYKEFLQKPIMFTTILKCIAGTSISHITLLTLFYRCEVLVKVISQLIKPLKTKIITSYFTNGSMPSILQLESKFSLSALLLKNVEKKSPPHTRIYVKYSLLSFFIILITKIG